LGHLENGLDIVAIGIENECSIVVCVTVGAHPWSTVISTTDCKRDVMKGINLRPACCSECQMAHAIWGLFAGEKESGSPLTEASNMTICTWDGKLLRNTKRGKSLAIEGVGFVKITQREC
jgi:hypothetical protein